MKRLLALLLALCMCTAVLSSCASCADEEENLEVPTAPKEFADAKLASKIKEGMTREEIRNQERFCLLLFQPTSATNLI